MKIRAVIFDIYKTLLHIGPAPVDAAARWKVLWNSTFKSAPRIGLNDFAVECEKIIAREHAVARAIGIVHPEIYWPVIATEVLPELSSLPEDAHHEFLYQHAQLQRTVRLMDGAADVLQRLVRENIFLGIASNSQPYTLRELDSALSAMNLTRAIFKSDFIFLSFENGFSKPNPHVFRILTAKLATAGLKPAEILMVGDRLDNDIEPARMAGWQTWWLIDKVADNAGGWQQLSTRLFS